MTHTSSSTTDRFVFLDYLRLIAFIFVLMGHKFAGNILTFLNAPETHATLRLGYYYLFQAIVVGGAGVIIFFFVSGYIITHVLQTDTPKTFIIKRFFRIYPLYALAVLAHYFLTTQVEPADNTLRSLVYHLFLIGDFTNTPAGLHGVEWTLRIELYFYLFMFFLSISRLTSQKKLLLPWIYLGTVALLFIVAPFPDNRLFNHGYVTFYAPFLFGGSMFYLYDKKIINIDFLFIFMLCIFIHYFLLISKYYSELKEFHFAIIGLAIFVLFWKNQHKLKYSSIIFGLSQLTYLLYLSHNWLYDIYNNLLLSLNIPEYFSIVITIFALVVTCYILHRWIERPFIRLGRHLTQRNK